MQRTRISPRDFGWVHWTPDFIEKVPGQIIEAKKKAYEAVKKIKPNERTFENTIWAIESSNYGFISDIHKIVLLMNVSVRQEVREAAKDAHSRIQQAMVEIEYDPELYRAFKEYAAKGEVLEGPDKKLFDDMEKQFHRMGFELPPEDQQKLKENLKKIAELSILFQKNINDYRDGIEVTLDELKGLRATYIDSLKKTADGKYFVSLDYPEYGPFQENAENEMKRKELAGKNLQKGGHANIKILQDLLKLRDENAKTLGYKNHVDFVTEIRMAKKGATVEKFLLDLAERSKGLAREELAELRELKRGLVRDPEAEIKYYDIAFFSNQLKKRKFGVDNEIVREYFPFEKVKSGVFQIYSTLFNLNFRKLEVVPLWHEDVEIFAVDEDNNTLGYFLLDLFPREGKYTHAAAMPIRPGYFDSFSKEGFYLSPICSMVANFNKPTAKKPSLLDHGEVRTFLHEFGHVIHYVLSRAPYASQNDFGVAWDFVETPSQMLENWAWAKEILQIISGHYQDLDKKLPDQLLENLLKAKLHMIGNFITRQVILSLFDLEIHSKSQEMDLTTFYNSLVYENTGIKLPDEAIFPASFGHMAGGYDGGYYGYLWSKIFAADLFTRFKKEGILSQKTGLDYRKKILEKGASEEELELVRNFLGRDPNQNAFLEEVGLHQNNPPAKPVG